VRPRRVQFSADTEGRDEAGEWLHRHVLHTERERYDLHRPDTAPRHHVSDMYVGAGTCTTHIADIPSLQLVVCVCACVCVCVFVSVYTHLLNSNHLLVHGMLNHHFILNVYWYAMVC